MLKKMKKTKLFNAFTLIELLTVILILGIISLITMPIVTRFIDNSKQKAYEQIVSNIEASAYNYSIYNDLGYSQLYKKLDISEIQDNGYLESKEIIDPRNNEKMDGCVLYRWLLDKNQYEFRYDEECNVENSQPEVTVNVINDNNKEWMTEKLKFEVKGEYDSYKYCIGDQDCEDIEKYIDTTTVDEEGKNIKICVVGYYGEEKGRRTCTKEYNVDTTKPETKITSVTTKTDRATVVASCTDLQSDITKYEFYDVLNNKWIDNEMTNSYTITGLKPETSYEFQARCTNKAGLVETVSKSSTTSHLPKPHIDKYDDYYAPGADYAQYISLYIDMDEMNEYEIYIKSDVYVGVANGVVLSVCGRETTPGTCKDDDNTLLESNTWYKITGGTDAPIKFTQNGTLYAYAKDKSGNISGASTYTVTDIDSTEPSASITSVTVKTDRATITANCSDNESGITKYEFYDVTTNRWVDRNTTNNYVQTGLNQNTNYNFQVRCTNGSGLTKVGSSSKTTSSITNPTIAQVSQTPTTGKYATQRVIKITYNGTNVESPKYYFKSSVEASAIKITTIPYYVGVVSECGNSTAPTNCTETSDRMNDNIVLKPGTWYEVNNTSIEIEYTQNGYLYAATKDPKGNIANASTYAVTNMDALSPDPPYITVDTTTTSAAVTASCFDTVSGITKYEFRLDNGKWIDNGGSSTYTFNGLAPSTRYEFSVRCTNAVNKSSENSIYELTKGIAPTITQVSQSPSSGAASSRVIRIDYHEENKSADYYFISTGSAKITYYSTPGYSLPIYNCGKKELPSSCIPITAGSSNQTTIEILANTWYKVLDKTVDLSYTGDAILRARSVVSAVESSAFRTVQEATYNVNNFIVTPPTTKWYFAYTGGVQTFTAPQAGRYKLEVWGAQGKSLSTSRVGGYGGYSTGEVTLTKGQTLYVVVGGQGGMHGSRIAAGYNGGAAGRETWGNGYEKPGGGATHIATTKQGDGQLVNYQSHQSDVLIVAGGGGGAGSSGGSNGKSGGGLKGGYKCLTWGKSGSKDWSCGQQTLGTNGDYSSFETDTSKETCKTNASKFGVGTAAFCATGTSNYRCESGSGGGGWYGGVGACGEEGNTNSSGGGGGSGYIGNSLLSNKVMYVFCDSSKNNANCSNYESNVASTKTITTANTDPTAISTYAKEGDGYARITFVQ